MLSLRSLAFILASAIRRARALSCAALHCSDIINRRQRRKMATNNPTEMATAGPGCMCSLLRTVYASEADHGSVEWIEGRARKEANARANRSGSFNQFPTDGWNRAPGEKQ
jgi:hypothetical protein